MPEIINELAMVLDRLFNERATENAPLDSIRSQAMFVDISAPQMSRLRTGKAPLTRRMVRKFSQKLGRTSEEKDNIYQRLIGLSNHTIQEVPTHQELNDKIKYHTDAIKEHQKQLKDLHWAEQNYEVWAKGFEILRRLK